MSALGAEAKSSYQSSFGTTYPIANGTRIDTCQICHVNADPDISSTRNSYGIAWKNAGKVFSAIESADSDGDGYSNLAEINALTFPGNAADKPASGSLTVTLEPAGARTAGAKWRVGTGGVWRNSGETATGLAVGTQTVQFSAVSGWVTPADRQVTILANQTTTLTVTYEPSTIAVPNITGLTESAALSALTGAGLVAGTITEQYSPTVPVGNVISQAPAAGTLVSLGSAVAFVVSLGVQPVPVPNVTGLTESAAVSPSQVPVLWLER